LDLIYGIRRIKLYINVKEVKNEMASIKAAMNKLVIEQSRMIRGKREYVEAGKSDVSLRRIQDLRFLFFQALPGTNQ